jgi:hypothetical protein
MFAKETNIAPYFAGTSTNEQKRFENIDTQGPVL